MATQTFINGILITDYFRYECHDSWYGESKSFGHAKINAEIIEKVRQRSGSDPNELVIFEYSGSGLLKETWEATTVLKGEEAEKYLKDCCFYYGKNPKRIYTDEEIAGSWAFT